MPTVDRVRGRSVTASDLESLGKSAARLSETSGLSLTEAAIRTLEAESLNAEQIRRAVESCNIAAVNAKFAALRGDHRIVHIDGGPADPVTVIDALHATASAPGAHFVASEYGMPPVQEKHAQALGPVYAPDLPALRRKLSAAHEELLDMATGVEFRMEVKLAELQDCARRASREGASLCDLASAWTVHDPAIAKVAAQSLREEIPWGVKTAGAAVNPQHDVMLKFAAFAEVAREYHTVSEARRAVEAELAEVSGFLNRQLS